MKSKESSKNNFICIKKNYPQNFLSKNVRHFSVYKYDSILGGKTGQKKGRWTLKEHIQYLQALEKFGVNWKKIYDLIPSRTPTQIRSHSQKFYKRLKECKNTEIGIDFTSRYINNINDMIAHIKSVNKDYNLVTVFLYLSEKCYPDNNPKKVDKINININDILCEDININNDSSFNNDIKEKIINKEINMNRQIINNNFNNISINNTLTNNINYFNCINDLDLLILFNLNNYITSNYIGNNISLQNNPLNNMDIFKNYFINNNSKNLLDKNYISNYPTNNLELTGVNKIEGNCL